MEGPNPKLIGKIDKILCIDCVHEKMDFSLRLDTPHYDFILANLVLLHFSDAQVRRLLKRVERLMTSKSIFLIKESAPTTSYIEK